MRFKRDILDRTEAAAHAVACLGDDVRLVFRELFELAFRDESSSADFVTAVLLMEEVADRLQEIEALVVQESKRSAERPDRPRLVLVRGHRPEGPAANDAPA